MPRNSSGIPAGFSHAAGHHRDTEWYDIKLPPPSRLAQTAALTPVERERAHRLDEKAL